LNIVIVRMKRILAGAAIGVILLSLTLGWGCGGGVSQTTFSQLISQPALFNNRTITVDAYYFSGFEISALSSALVPSTFNPANITPVQPLIWTTGSLGETAHQALKQQSNTPSGYTEYYGHVRITGIFQYGGKYGHLDAYGFLITVTSATILP
jgi:hypothetical protein